MSENETPASLNFIEAAIEEDLKSGRCAGPVGVPLGSRRGRFRSYARLETRPFLQDRSPC